jgi:hypothetical protein
LVTGFLGQIGQVNVDVPLRADQKQAIAIIMVGIKDGADKFLTP